MKGKRFGRDFQLWAYDVSHSCLLLRSTKTDACPTQLDVLFKNVTRIELPARVDDLEVDDLGAGANGIHRYRLTGTDAEGCIVAGAAAWLESDLDYDAPSPLLSGWEHVDDT